MAVYPAHRTSLFWRFIGAVKETTGLYSIKIPNVLLIKSHNTLLTWSRLPLILCLTLVNLFTAVNLILWRSSHDK